MDCAKAALTAKPSGDGGFDRGSTGSNAKSETPIALSGSEWYSQQAHRAVNQAIGRVIRHRADYGAILFLDSRFSEERNQQGVSKWIRPCFETDNGVGGSIQGLVKFFRGAKAKADANKILLEKQNTTTTRGLQLKYEQETTSNSPNEKPSGHEITKIAFVKKAEKTSTSSADDELLEGYVPPNRIIKQVKVEDIKLSSTKSKPTVVNEKHPREKVVTKGLASLYKPNAGSSLQKISTTVEKSLSRTIDSAWSSIDKNGGIERNQQKFVNEQNREKSEQKQLAQRFFKLATASLDPKDFALVRKMLVALNGLGAKKDKISYTKTAKKLIALLLRYDDSHSTGQSKGLALVDLLSSLLPEMYRLEIQKTACKMRFESSLFYKVSNESLPADELLQLSETFPNLMIDHEQWKNDPKHCTSEKSLVNDLGHIISILIKHRLATNKDLLFSLKRLLTMRMRNMTTILLNEMRAKQKVSSLKEMDRKMYGEEGINKTLFMKPDQSLKLSKEQNEYVKGKDIETANNDPSLHAGPSTNVLPSQTLPRKKPLHQQNPYVKKKVTNLGNNISSSLSSPEPANVISTRPSKRARLIMDLSTPKMSEQKLNNIRSSRSDSKGLDPLEMALKQAKNEIYKKATPKIVRINNLLKSNVPAGTRCNICNKNSNAVSLIIYGMMFLSAPLHFPFLITKIVN